jgi:signal recognition particle subunit SEC65
MKLVCEKYANQKFILSSGEIVADENGVVEVKDKDVVKVLKDIGFSEIRSPKESKKPEEPKEEPKQQKQEPQQNDKKRFFRSK